MLTTSFTFFSSNASILSTKMFAWWKSIELARFFITTLTFYNHFHFVLPLPAYFTMIRACVKGWCWISKGSWRKIKGLLHFVTFFHEGLWELKGAHNHHQQQHHHQHHHHQHHRYIFRYTLSRCTRYTSTNGKFSGMRPPGYTRLHWISQGDHNDSCIFWYKVYIAKLSIIKFIQ